MSKKPLSSSPPGSATLFDTIIPGTSQILNITSSSVQSSAFLVSTTCIEIFATVDCFIAFGSNPTATGSSYFVAGGIYKIIGLPINDSTNVRKIAVIYSTVTGASATGLLFLTEAGA